VLVWSEAGGKDCVTNKIPTTLSRVSIVRAVVCRVIVVRISHPCYTINNALKKRAIFKLKKVWNDNITNKSYRFDLNLSPN
jgi:hypothetical protein